jgi:hypothetical protein
MEEQQMEILGQPKQFANGGIVNALMATPVGQAALRQYATGGEVGEDVEAEQVLEHTPTGATIEDILAGRATFFGPAKYRHAEVISDISDTLGVAPIKKKKKEVPWQPDDDLNEGPKGIDPVTGVQIGRLSEFDYDPDLFIDDPAKFDWKNLIPGAAIAKILQIDKLWGEDQKKREPWQDLTKKSPDVIKWEKNLADAQRQEDLLKKEQVDPRAKIVNNELFGKPPVIKAVPKSSVSLSMEPDLSPQIDPRAKIVNNERFDLPSVTKPPVSIPTASPPVPSPMDPKSDLQIEGKFALEQDRKKALEKGLPSVITPMSAVQKATQRLASAGEGPPLPSPPVPGITTLDPVQKAWFGGTGIGAEKQVTQPSTDRFSRATPASAFERATKGGLPEEALLGKTPPTSIDKMELDPSKFGISPEQVSRGLYSLIPSEPIAQAVEDVIYNLRSSPSTSDSGITAQTPGAVASMLHQPTIAHYQSMKDLYGDDPPELTDRQMEDIVSQVDTFSEISDVGGGMDDDPAEDQGMYE